MNKNKALEVMLTEKCCVERQDDISKCDRRCGECDLLLPTEEVLQAYDFVINMLTEKKRPQGRWIREDKPWGGFGDSILVLTCSECGESFVFHGNEPKFCSECGAEMEADNETD